MSDETKPRPWIYFQRDDQWWGLGAYLPQVNEDSQPIAHRVYHVDASDVIAALKQNPEFLAEVLPEILPSAEEHARALYEQDEGRLGGKPQPWEQVDEEYRGYLTHDSKVFLEALLRAASEKGDARDDA